MTILANSQPKIISLCPLLFQQLFKWVQNEQGWNNELLNESCILCLYLIDLVECSNWCMRILRIRITLTSQKLISETKHARGLIQPVCFIIYIWKNMKDNIDVFWSLSLTFNRRWEAVVRNCEQILTNFWRCFVTKHILHSLM